MAVEEEEEQEQEMVVAEWILGFGISFTSEIRGVFG